MATRRLTQGHRCGDGRSWRPGRPRPIGQHLHPRWLQALQSDPGHLHGRLHLRWCRCRAVGPTSTPLWRTSTRLSDHAEADLASSFPIPEIIDVAEEGHHQHPHLAAAPAAGRRGRRLPGVGRDHRRVHHRWKRCAERAQSAGRRRCTPGQRARQLRGHRLRFQNEELLDGVRIYATNVYEPPTARSIQHLLPRLRHLLAAADPHRVQRRSCGSVGRHGLSVVDLRGHFDAHGFHRRQQLATYDAEDPTLWCGGLHPSQRAWTPRCVVCSMAIMGHSLALEQRRGLSVNLFAMEKNAD